DELVVVVARGLAEVWELDVDGLPPHAATPTPTRTALRASAGLDRARWRGARWRRARWRTPGLVMTVCKLCSFGRSLCSGVDDDDVRLAVTEHQLRGFPDRRRRLDADDRLLG